MCLPDVPVPGVVCKIIKVLKSTRPNYSVSHNWSSVTLSGFGQCDVASLKATTRLSSQFPALQWFWKDKLTAVHHVISWCKTLFFFLISFPPFWPVVERWIHPPTNATWHSFTEGHVAACVYHLSHQQLPWKFQSLRWCRLSFTLYWSPLSLQPLSKEWKAALTKRMQTERAFS